ncbi:hypothetical protein C8R42DRAFT_718310 [Lentinula raphanica]|nr:hypothetical protein C8R42DRAFT_718310 [Lentinula raphanica]
MAIVIQGLTVVKSLFMATMILCGPLKSTCLTFNVSSPTITEAALFVSYTRESADPQNWIVLATSSEANSNSTIPLEISLPVPNQSQLGGSLMLHRFLSDINITLQGMEIVDSITHQPKLFGNRSNPFTVPALQENSTVSIILISSMSNPNPTSATSTTTSMTHSSQTQVRASKNTKTHIIIGAAISLLTVVIALTAVLYVKLRRRRRRNLAPSEFMREKLVRVPDRFGGVDEEYRTQGSPVGQR